MRRLVIGLGIAVALVAMLLAGLAVCSWAMTRQVEAQFPPLGRFVTVEGLRLHLLTAGQGRPVVLLHGANGAVQDFKASIFDRLAQQYRVVAIDRPGHGYSDRPAAGIVTPDIQARLIRGALKQLGV